MTTIDYQRKINFIHKAHRRAIRRLLAKRRKEIQAQLKEMRAAA